MTEGMGVEGQGAPTEEVSTASQDQTQDAGQGGGGINPAWNEVLGVVPQELHSQITPHLQKWDQNYDKVQSQYAPYKQFIDANVDPENIAFALNAMQQIEQDPKSVVESLTQYMKDNGLLEEEPPVAGQDQGQVGGEELPEVFQHPEYQKLQQELQQVRQLAETMGQSWVQQQQAEQEAAEDEELQEQIETLKTEVGEFDVEWVLQKAVLDVENGKEVTDLKPYVEQYRQFEQSIVEKHQRPAPQMLPSGGQAPNNQTDMKSLSDSDRRKFIADRLRATQASQ
jgi:hypothetical protein